MTEHGPISSTDDEPTEASAGAAPAAEHVNARAPLPRLPTALADEEIRSRLIQAARRGRLPGFEGAPSGGGVLFAITDFGVPFESRLLARRDEGGLAFETHLKPLFPAIFAAVLLFSVWPGVWFTESMFETYLPGTWLTRYVWWWYLILTVPFLPWAMWAAVKKSRRSARIEAEKLIERIGTILE